MVTRLNIENLGSFYFLWSTDFSVFLESKEKIKTHLRYLPTPNNDYNFNERSCDITLIVT